MADLVIYRYKVDQINILNNIMEGEMMQGGHCKCPHHKMTGLGVTLIGLLFLLGALGVVSAQVVGIGWPIILMAIGVTKLTKGMCKCCDRGKCEGGKCQ